MSFNIKLTNLLKTDPRFLDDEGELVIAAVQDRAWKIDHNLVKLLLSDKEVKAKFFDEIEGHWVFNTNTFIDYISQKNFLDNSYTRFRNRIGLTIGDKYLGERGDVALVWPYKDTVLEGGQTKEEEKRDEIFFNEVLAEDEINRLLDPKVLTNFVRYTSKGQEPVKDFKRDKNGIIRENLIIKGNNLLALHSLQSQFAEEVKLVYIDPPYNIGNASFGYNDNFNHSSWLTFMKNRLAIAKTLLRDDGVIFIQCDDIEQAYLKVLCDEMFTRENFINIISYERSGSAGIGQGGFFVDTTEFILIYAKNKNLLRFNEILKSSLLDYEVMKRYNKILSDEGKKIIIKEFKSKSNREPVKIFKHTNYEIESISLRDFDDRENEIRKTYLKNFIKIFRTTNPQAENLFQQELISNMKEGLYSVEYTPSRGKSRNQLIRTYYNNREIFAWLKDSAEIRNNEVVKKDKLSTVWLHGEIPKADLANEGGVKLRRGKKPEQLLKRIMNLCTQKDDIVLDFYLGSGTTAAVAHKLGYQYVGIEQLKYGDNDSIIRLQNVINGDKTGISKSVKWQGGGDFICCELMKYNEAFMERIQAAKSSEELLRIWEQMAKDSFLNWYINPKVPAEAIKDFESIGQEDNGLKKQKRLLAELLDKNQLYVNLSEINDVQFNVSKEDKALNRAFYGEA
jgi:adenine-specific DNA-methyltransferase